MERILYFMTRKGLINTGILSVSPDQYLLPKEYHNVSCCNNPYVISAIKLHGTCKFFLVLDFCSLSIIATIYVKITSKSKHIACFSRGSHLPSMAMETTDMGLFPARFLFPLKSMEFSSMDSCFL